MLKKVSICDFTKCIAQFSGLGMQGVKDEVIKRYLLKWAKNKYKFFKMLGNNTKKDISIEYKNIKDDIDTEICAISKDFPAYAPWLKGFRYIKQNKIDNKRELNYEILSWIDNYFSGYNIEGNTMTHFFKKYLSAPDELVTAIGRIFENKIISATYTLSIDPVDMMLASENPYDWVSCYRLALENDSSHADGCLAAILDNSSLITYIWNREGKFMLYNTYDFKNIRYKRMRQWISIEPDMNAIHFNTIYPGKSYSEDFEKQLRVIVEDIVANYKGVENKWIKDENCNCSRYFEYGYSEYNRSYIWKLKNCDYSPSWKVFNESIKCPCGCDNILPGSYKEYDDNLIYNGEGFLYENYEKKDWCDYCDDWCDHECYEEECEDCCYWKQNHPLCSLESDEECDNPDYTKIEYDGIMRACEDHCEGCPLWEEYHKIDAEVDSVEA
jgi:hypothetical protein